MKPQIAHSGISLLLTMFVTLSLLGFAVLSTSIASSDLSLSERYAEETSDYYAAVSEAETFKAETAKKLHRLYDDAADEAAFFAGTERTISKIFPYSDREQLVLELEVIYPERDQNAPGTVVPFRVVSERIESVGTFNYDESLHVLGSE